MNVKLVILQLLCSNQENENLENIERALQLCENYVGVYEKISPGYTKWRGHILELQSAALLKKSQLQVLLNCKFRLPIDFVSPRKDRRIWLLHTRKTRFIYARLVTSDINDNVKAK